MAYSAIVGHKIEYDRDGTKVINFNTAGLYVSQIPTAELAAQNGNSLSYSWSGNTPPGFTGSPATGYRPGNLYTVFMFPVAMSLTHCYANTNTSSMWYSTDTTDGWDGTWTVVTFPGTDITVYPVIGHRTKPAAFTGQPITGVKAVRIYHTWNDGNYYMNAFHLYGYPTSTPESLQLWHPTLDQRLDANTQFNVGAIAQGSTATATFRVKNVGSVYSTTNVTMSAQSTTSGTSEATVAATVQFSTDNATWFSTLNLGSLAPGAISALTYVRVSPAVTTPINPGQVRIVATGTP